MSLSARFDEALAYAHEAHRDQLRKGTKIPYISHLMAVAGLVLENGGDEDTAIAALLHDTIEDGGGDAARQEIRRRFGRRVADIVDECTDAEVIPKPPWRERKERYIAHLRHASPQARLVSAADKLHNARAILADYRVVGEALWERFNADRDGVLWYYQSLVAALKEGGATPLIEELERVVNELTGLVKQISGVGSCIST
ncbi:MAG: GTP pyrophosphokinase [Syntrophaceae bacterium PtaB.Bin038]|jgi:(p)ppGpp synthase/HD superfamily hydrolase|nr:MAG: GTP pyrophosphokinase [Syntrophaceae bacterium PtaB.Bin038]